MRLSFILPVICLALTSPAQTTAPASSGAGNSAETTPQNAKRHSSELGLHILQQVELAKQSLAANQTQAAVQHVDHALEYRDRLAARPNAHGGPIIVPLYWEFDNTSVLGRTLAARNGGRQQPPKSAPITVEKAGMQYTFVGLDLNKVRTRLDNAKSALSSNDPQAAARSLNHIADELVVTKVREEYPLLAARENLGLAELAVRSGHYGEAAAALKEASTTLDQYANGHSAHRPYEAKSLSKRIASLSQTVAREHADSASKIAGWWNEVNGWFTHPLTD